jgi:thioredoxin-like negative regulator of GroEL
MTQPTRRQKIQAMLEEDPADVFLRYSLAMELDKEGDHVASLAQFHELQRETPPYVPAFFMAAQLLVRLDQVDQARGLLREGIEIARGQDNAHAASEMSELLAALGSAGESAG